LCPGDHRGGAGTDRGKKKKKEGREGAGGGGPRSGMGRKGLTPSLRKGDSRAGGGCRGGRGGGGFVRVVGCTLNSVEREKENVKGGPEEKPSGRHLKPVSERKVSLEGKWGTENEGGVVAPQSGHVGPSGGGDQSRGGNSRGQKNLLGEQVQDMGEAQVKPQTSGRGSNWLKDFHQREGRRGW